MTSLMGALLRVALHTKDQLKELEVLSVRHLGQSEWQTKSHIECLQVVMMEHKMVVVLFNKYAQQRQHMPSQPQFQASITRMSSTILVRLHRAPAWDCKLAELR